MSESIPIKTPGGFAPAFVLGQADAGGNLLLVSADNPLPVTGGGGGATPAPAPPPLAGTTFTPLIAGPFDPVPGRAVYLQLAGEWQGRVRLLRSTDGGATKAPLTIGGTPWAVFTGPACEAVWEEGDAAARLYLDLQPTSGTISYRVSQ